MTDDGKRQAQKLSKKLYKKIESAAYKKEEEYAAFFMSIGKR